MIAPADSPGPAPDRRGWLVLLAIGLGLAAVILTMVWHRAASSTDFRDFWENAVQFRQTGIIADDQGVHNYLPFFTIFMTPWGVLPLRPAAVLFVALSLGLFGLTVYMVELLLAGEAPRRSWRPVLIAVGLMLPYVYACGVVGNLGLLLLFLVVTTWFFVERGREWEAGIPLGLAVLIKLLPAVLILFFLMKRRWRVAGSAVAVILVLGIGLPLAAVGPMQTFRDHDGFRKRAIEAHSPYATLTSEKPLKTKYNNNALPMVLRRWFSPINAGDDEPDRQIALNAVTLPGQTRLVVYAVLLAVFVLGSLLATLRGPRRWPPETVTGVRALREQFGIWCCLMLLASPLVWTHYLPLVYWPLAVVADRAVRLWSMPGRRPWVETAGLLLWLGGVLLLAWPTARAAGAQLVGIAALWAVLTATNVRCSAV